MNRVKHFCNEHRYMFLFSFIILIAQYIGNFEQIYDPSEFIYTYHIVDFRLGLVSKVIQGQIFQFFFPDVTMQKIKIFSLVMLALVALFAGYFLEEIYFFVKKENRAIVLFLIIIFCISGSTFNIFYRQLGMLDVYWIYALVFFLAFLHNKKTWFLIPISFVFMVAVHYGALLSYIPLMSTIILFKAASSKDKGEKKYLITVFFASVIFTLCAVAFLYYNDRHNLNYTIDELHNYFDSRGTNYYTYYDYAYFRNYTWSFPDGTTFLMEDIDVVKSNLVPAFIKSIINEIARAMHYTALEIKSFPALFENVVPKLIVQLLSLVPILALIYGFFIKLYRLAEDKLKKFSLVCAMALFPFTALTPAGFSSDYFRWISHAFICCYICFFVIMKTSGEEFALPSNQLNSKKKICYLLYSVLCFVVRFNPYTELG